MMGARRKISASLLFTGSYGEYSSKSLPVEHTHQCEHLNGLLGVSGSNTNCLYWEDFTLILIIITPHCV